MNIYVELVNKASNIVKVTITDAVDASPVESSYIINRKVPLGSSQDEVYSIQQRDFSFVRGDVCTTYSFYETLNSYGTTYEYSVVKMNNTTFAEERSNVVNISAPPKPVEEVILNIALSVYDPEFNLPSKACIEWKEYDGLQQCSDVIGFNIYYSLSKHHRNTWTAPEKVRGLSTGDTLSAVTLIPTTETSCIIDVPQLTDLDSPMDIRIDVVAITNDVQSEMHNPLIIETMEMCAGTFIKDTPLVISSGSKDDTDEQLHQYGKVIDPAYSISFEENAFREDTVVWCEKTNESHNIIGWDNIYSYFINLKDLNGSVEVAIYMPYNSIAKYDVRVQTNNIFASVPWGYNANDSTIRFRLRETCKFVLVSKDDVGPSAHTSAFSQATRRIIDRLPSWSKIRRTPAKSNGAYFLELIGMEFDAFEELMNYVQEQMYINTVSLGQIASVYKYYLPQDTAESDQVNVMCNGAYMEEAESIEVFYKSHLEKTDFPEIYFNNLIMIDMKEKVVYIRNANGNISIAIRHDDEEKEYFIDKAPELRLHKVWNFFDELGLLFDLNRYEWESNESFKERILDVFRNPSNSSRDGLMNGIARELCIRKSITWDDTSTDLVISDGMVIYNKIKVDGEYVDEKDIYFTNDQNIVIKARDNLPNGVEVSYVSGLEMHTLFNADDEMFSKVLYDSDGKATDSLLMYANLINDKVPLKWGSFHWNEGYWDAAANIKDGTSYIPSLYDASCKGFEGVE